jgi:hypothetical protein
MRLALRPAVHQERETGMKLMIFCALASATLFAACGGDDGDDQPPSCQQAFTHYYESGCRYFELATGAEIPLGEMIDSCRDILSTAPATCEDDVENWLFCLDDVPSNSTTNAQCDCSQEQESLLTCE